MLSVVGGGLKRLVELRDDHHWTQADLGKLIGKSQQTIAKWESGGAEPDIAALRDLAVLFGTTVDDILGAEIPDYDEDGVRIGLTLTETLRDTNREDFWGHVGLLLPGQQQTKWLPVTERASGVIASSLANLGRDEWIMIATLCGRILALNPTRMSRIWLLNDDCDGIEGDYEDIEDPEAAEIFSSLQEFASYLAGSGEDVETTMSQSLRDTLMDYLKTREIDTEDDEAVLGFAHDSHIWFTDGSKLSYWVEGRDLYQILSQIEICGDVPLTGMLSLTAFGDRFSSFFPAHSIAMIDMPWANIVHVLKLHQEQHEPLPQPREAPRLYESSTTRRKRRVRKS